MCFMQADHQDAASCWSGSTYMMSCWRRYNVWASLQHLFDNVYTSMMYRVIPQRHNKLPRNFMMLGLVVSNHRCEPLMFHIVPLGFNKRMPWISGCCKSWSAETRQMCGWLDPETISWKLGIESPFLISIVTDSNVLPISWWKSLRMV